MWSTRNRIDDILFFSSRRRHTRSKRDWSSDVCSSDLLFDGVVISGEVGLHKPQPEIFRLGAEWIGVAPEECVFVDDLRENCEGAEAVGMTAVRHRNAAETIAKLAELTGVSLAAAV